METQFRYEQLADILRERISLLPSGSRLPSVRSLIKRHSVSLPTVQAALSLLENENLLVIKKRSGSFVSDKRSVKFIILHRCRSPSVVSDEMEMSLLEALTAEGWQMYSKRHALEGNTFRPDTYDEADLRACAHIVTGELTNLRYGLLPGLLAQNVPVVIMGREAGELGVDSVSGDERQIMFSLVKHLRSLGHERFGFLVNEPSSFQAIVTRTELFQSALKVFDLPEGTIIDCHTQAGERSPAFAYSGLREYLADTGQDLPFTALIVASAAGGPGALRAMHETGIRVPLDCSVATVGLGQNGELLIPSLTEAGDPPSATGETIAKLLKMRFAGNDTETLALKVPPTLCSRESTGPAPTLRKRKPKPDLAVSSII